MKNIILKGGSRVDKELDDLVDIYLVSKIDDLFE